MGSGDWRASRPEVIPEDAVLDLPSPRPDCGAGQGSSSTASSVDIFGTSRDGMKDVDIG